MKFLLEVLLIDPDENLQTLLEQVAQHLAIETSIFDPSLPLSKLQSHPDCILFSAKSLEASSLPLLHKLHVHCASPIVAIVDSVDPALDRWQEAGVWEVLYQAELTPERLIQSLQSAVPICQERPPAPQRLWQNELWLRQAQTIKQQERQIQRLKAQLLEASQLKMRFLATVSHELRTPMNAILGFSQLLQRSPDLSSRQLNMVERIFSNAKQLMDSIDQILKFSKIEAGQLKLHFKAISLTHLIRAVVAELQPEAAKKNLKLKTQFNLHNPVIVTDPTCLQQVIFNLLTNAIKFTRSGSVTLEVKELAADRVLILIRDTGIGMTATELDYIFEPFRQVDQSNARGYPGMGLGLAVTAALVQQMQGTIAVNSQLEAGSEFRIELPRQTGSIIPIHSLDSTASVC